MKTTKTQRLIEKMWQLLDEHTYLTASALAILIFGRNRIMEFTQKIKILVKKNPKLFTCYYPKGHNYICTMETRINIRTKFFK